MTTSARDARELVRLAAKAEREIVIAHGWNFKPWVPEARRLAAGVGRVEHIVLQMANALDDLFAGAPMKETEGAMFRPPASTWADPKRAGGFGWGQLVHPLGLLFRIVDLEPREVFALTGQSPARVDYYDAAAVRFAGGATASLSGAATLPKGRPVQVDLRIFGAEGMLLLDLERERLELRRRDGRDEVVALKAGDGAYVCDEPVRAFVDLCLGRKTENGAPGLVGQRAVEVLGERTHETSLGRERADGGGLMRRCKDLRDGGLASLAVEDILNARLLDALGRADHSALSLLVPQCRDPHACLAHDRGRRRPRASPAPPSR